MTHIWTSSKKQAGGETDEGQWHMRPHPPLTKQFRGDKGKASEHMYWHPDYVIFKRSDGWHVSRTANPLPNYYDLSKQSEGPFKTKPIATAWADTNGEEQA